METGNQKTYQIRSSNRCGSLSYRSALDCQGCILNCKRTELKVYDEIIIDCKSLQRSHPELEQKKKRVLTRMRDKHKVGSIKNDCNCNLLKVEEQVTDCNKIVRSPMSSKTMNPACTL